MHRAIARAAAAALAAALAAPAAQAACATLPTVSTNSLEKRALTPDDLLTLRDIGYPDPLLMGGPSPLGVSPDGQHVAFLVNQADPASNGYCRLLVMQAVAGGRARVVDRGGELITITDVQRGMFVRGGFPALVTPVWSANGEWIAYLRRDHGSTQVWRVRADGGRAEQVTRLATDVEAIAWGGGGRLVYATRPALRSLNEAIDREGRTGWLYDSRVVTFSGPRPQIREADAPIVAFSIDPGNGSARAASPDEKARLGPVGAAGLSAETSAIAANGSRAWVELRGLASSSASDIKVSLPSGRELTCPTDTCRGGVISLWWSGDGQELRFLRRQGWNKGDMALYRWRPGEDSPRQAFVTQDALIGCVAAMGDLICTRENATTPRRLVRIETVSGRSEVIFDPNPEFANIRLGSVERLKWRNDRGLEVWGDLVLPPNHRVGQKVPLVVVQYSSRGFLRGGTADEYPIFAFAEQGIAVLSLERPPFVASLDPTITEWTDFAKANQRDWAERRSLLSAIETGVRLVIDRGIADPTKIGITGLSDGATTARFALINSKLFSAAAISSCCLEPWTVNTYVGIAYADFIQDIGYPSLIKPDPEFWRPMSIAQNAARIDTPLLMQLNDDDGYIMALEAFESLREHGKPVEMYVFPDEYHAKWQPVHRRAIYQRNLDWFNFWLRGVEDADPAKTAQYVRWREMRNRKHDLPVLDGGAGRYPPQHRAQISASSSPITR